MAFFAYHLLVLVSSLLLCTIASARPLSIPQSDDADPSIPWSLIIACLVSLLVLLALLAVKFVYIKRRRLTAIRSQSFRPASPYDISLNSSSSLQVKATHSPLLAFLVGYLGSPSRETGMESMLDKNSLNQGLTASFMYRLHRQSKQHSSKSYSVVCNSSKSVISQAHPSPTRMILSISSSAFSGEHSTEDATNFWPDPSTNLNMFTHSTKVWSRTTATVDPQRCSLLDDRSGQLGNFCEQFDTNCNNFRECFGDWTTTVVDHGPTSLRLVGVTDVTAVPYSFLSAFPPSSCVLSPLTGTRDSLQLSRSHSKLNRKPVPSLPPLPFYGLPGQEPSCIPLSDVPPSPRSRASIGSVSAVADQVPTQMSDNNPSLASNHAKVEAIPLVSPNLACTYTLGKSLPRASDPTDPLVFAVQKMTRTTKHKHSSTTRSRSGIIPCASPLRTVVFPEDMKDRKPTGDTSCDKENSAPCVSKTIDVGQILQSTKDASYRFYPLAPPSFPDIELASRRLNQPPNRLSSTRSVKSTKSITHSDVEGSLSDFSSLQTPRFDQVDEVDIGMLGLDRFHWSEEGEDIIQSHSSNIKNDSVAVVSFWEEGEWISENNQCSDIGIACLSHSSPCMKIGTSYESLAVVLLIRRALEVLKLERCPPLYRTTCINCQHEVLPIS
ncbi:hypothetical protein K503DRAFT_213933 [Rhizopogon vinicolor AM-OR11-026]|uniref:Uncharacterized protein n=1 Tax=Rhizopogon vinicolor AM-OR11-026 TaxID=1314800 RepID=A0A1B7MYU9_9AGAM|nr:hypothetical protein K503DRAFT_213933 [Rhizopogon vinicolor AM-OR11-026]